MFWVIHTLAPIPPKSEIISTLEANEKRNYDLKMYMFD
jgi:hypothetical protein